MKRDEINRSYFESLYSKNLKEILYTGNFTSLYELDKCTLLWHKVGF